MHNQLYLIRLQLLLPHYSLKPKLCLRVSYNPTYNPIILDGNWIFPFSQLTLGIYFHLWYILKRHCGSVSISLQLWLVWGDSDHSFSSITVNQFVNASTFLFTWLHSRILCWRQQCSKYLSGGINLCQCTLLELIFPSTNMIAASFLHLSSTYSLPICTKITTT